MASRRDIPASFDLPLIFGLALAVRLAMLVFAWDAPRLGDEHNYWRMSGAVLEGRYTDAFFPPLWPFILAVVRIAWSQPGAARVAAIVLGAAIAAGTYALAKSVYGRRTALAAGLIIALNPELVFFDHYIYAEPIVGALLLLGTWLVFRTPLALYSARSLSGAMLAWGLGLLAKLFSIFPFGALWIVIVMFRRPLIRRIALASLLFFLPAGLFSLKQYLAGQDPAMLTNVAIKNARDHVAGGSRYFKPSERSGQLSIIVEKMRAQEPGLFIRRFLRNVRTLWGPRSYVTKRLRERRFYEFRNTRGLIRLIETISMIIFAAGLLGLCTSPPSLFRTHSILTLALFTMTGLLFVVVSRHRVPFAFLIHLYAGWFVTHARPALRNLRSLKYGGFAAILGLFGVLACLA